MKMKQQPTSYVFIIAVVTVLAVLSLVSDPIDTAYAQEATSTLVR
jgi:hypothetical protein